MNWFSGMAGFDMKTYESFALISQSVSKAFLQKAVIVFIYLTIFWMLLPVLLFSIGFKMDSLVNIDLHLSQIMGWILLFAGLAIILIAFGQLRFQGKGFPISHLAPEIFVASGTYKYFRHPIYVGYTISFAGISMVLNSGMSLLFSTPILLFGWIGYAMFYEEKVLIIRFGSVYEKYKASVPMLITKKIGSLIKYCYRPFTDRTIIILNKFANKTILFKKGNIIFVTYGLLISIGALLALSFTSIVLLEHAFTETEISILIAGWALSSAIGGRIFWWLGHLHHLIKEPYFGFIKVGFVSWGGLTGLFLFSYLFSLLSGHPFLVVSDYFLRGIFIAYAVGRLGCLTYGCCCGNRARGSGINYENTNAKILRENNNIKMLRYPVQFFSFLQGMALFVILNVLAMFNLSPGLITAIGFMLYPIGRAYIEFFRDRKKRFFNLITDGHLGCFFMFAAGFVILHIIPGPIAGYEYSAWNLKNLSNIVPLLPMILCMSLLVFIVMGFHWKKVGQW